MRAALLFAVWLPLAAFAESGLGVPASDFAKAETADVEPAEVVDGSTPGEKSPEQIHSPMLVYDQPVPPPTTVAKEPDEEVRTDKDGKKLSVPTGGGGGGASSSGRPQRTGPGQSPSGNVGAPTYPSPTNPSPPSNPPPPPYGGGSGSGSGDATAARQLTTSGSPCSRDSYHNTVMKKGLDVARMNCKLHQLDKNRGALWGLAGGDPVKRWVMEKQLDKALDVFHLK